MQGYPVTRTQMFYARLAGFMYLLNYAVDVFGQVVPSVIIGTGEFADSARRVFSSGHLYGAALASMTIGWVSVVMLGFALYVTLEPVNRRIAQIALCFRLGESFIGAVTVMFAFVTMNLYTAGHTPGPLQDKQLQELVAVTQVAGGNGFQVAMTFFSVGSTLFFYLFFKSRYLPRPLAAFGVLASVLMCLVSLANLIFPEYGSELLYGWGPIGIAEISTAFWLAIAGIRQPSLPVGELEST